MTQMRIPAAPEIRTTGYGSLRGVDFSVDPSLVDKRRSPYAPNMISDDGGNPVKRFGWRVLHQLPGRINGLFSTEFGGRQYILAHAGSTLQQIYGESVQEIRTGISDHMSTAFYMENVGVESVRFNSDDYSGTYPMTMSLPPGSYSISLGGGKGADISFTDRPGNMVTGSGGLGGKIEFDIDLTEHSQVRMEKITNGSEKYRTSFHIYFDDVLYAAVGGGGDAGGGDILSGDGYYNVHKGGAGGSENGGDSDDVNGSANGKGARGEIGGDGGCKGKVESKKDWFTYGSDGSNAPIGKGGGTNSKEVLGVASSGAGGCGYAGGGEGGDYTRNGTYTSCYNGGGGGGSSFVKKDAANVTLISNSQGVNNGPGYARIKSKAGSNSKLFLLTGRELLSFDGDKIKTVSEEAYVPTVVISRSPNGGGTVYEAANLINPKRTDSFLGDNTSKTYQLTATGIDDDEIIVKAANDKGDYDTLKEGTDFTVDRSAGKVTFSVVHPPVVTGEDNVLITYSKKIAGYLDRIHNCTICTTYGVGGSNRAFLSGNPEYLANDWWSDINRPDYFPDLNYAVVGTANTAITGYLKIGEYLAIVKEDNQQDTTIFLRSGMLNEKGDAIFTVKPGVVGIGALSKQCFCNLGDEPLFLSRRGVYAVTSTLLSYERVVKNRSYFVDKKLAKEPGLDQAVACEWNGYYLLAVNGNCYLLDSRHRSGERNGNTDFIYECYFWSNVPAICLLSVSDQLYFGTADGRLCRLNTDIDNMTAFSDGGKLNPETGRVEGGIAIDAAWFTPNDDDGLIYLFKTLQKKGSLVTILPYDRSSGEVCLVVDGNPEEFVKKENMDIFNWEDIDFERFTFSSNSSPQEIYFYKKKKKYKRLQIGIRNRQLNEGFGIVQIVKSYAVGGHSKNRGY